MRRREFITLLGGAAAAWPFAARAQQPERMRHIGVLMARGETIRKHQTRVAAFLQGLQQLGWSERPQRTDRYPLGAGDADRIADNAAEIVCARTRRHPRQRRLARGRRCCRRPRTVPIVFALVTDPSAAGFVASLARPGGNATGFIAFEYGMAGKWLELLKADRASA